MGYPQIANQIEEKPHDYRRHYGPEVQNHYPIHFLLCGR